jgi:N-methylhydantoinase A
LLDVRYQGQSYELTLPFTAEYRTEFDNAHAAAFGHSEPEMPIEIVNLRIRAIGQLPRPLLSTMSEGPESVPEPFAHRPIVIESGVASVPLYYGQQLQTGHHLVGPLIVLQPDTTIYVPARSQLRVDPYLNFIIEV